jgi:flavodoxin
MNIKIFYFSNTGNTKKIAETIADELNCNAESIAENNDPVSADILFIGAAVYATFNHGINPSVAKFIEKLDPKKIGKVALFCTGFADTAIGIMKGHLAKKGITVAENSFFCKGKLFLFFNFGHPNRTDFENAKQFARNAVKKTR